MQEVRFSAVSGSHYPSDGSELRTTIEDLLGGSKQLVSTGEHVAGMILPQLGYQISGDLLALGYRQLLDEDLEQVNQEVDEIFISGESLLHQFHHAAISDLKYWETPLGRVEQSHKMEKIVLSDNMRSKDLLRFDNSAHDGEATIEIQLPFIQTVLPEKKIVPIATGDISSRLLYGAIEKHIGEDDLLVVSSNLTENMPREFVKDADQLLIRKITELDLEYISSGRHLSNEVGVNLICMMAKERGWKPKLLAHKIYDDPNDSSRSIGMAAIIFLKVR